MVDLLHAYIEAGFTENVVYVHPGGEPVSAAEIAAERVLPEIVGRRVSELGAGQSSARVIVQGDAVQATG